MNNAIADLFDIDVVLELSVVTVRILGIV